MTEIPICTICHNTTLCEISGGLWKNYGTNFCCPGTSCHPKCIEEHFIRNGLQCLICRKIYDKPGVYISNPFTKTNHDIEDFLEALPAQRNLETGNWYPNLLGSKEMGSYILMGALQLSCPHHNISTCDVENITCDCFVDQHKSDLVDKMFSYMVSGIQSCDCFVGNITDVTNLNKLTQLVTEASLAFANHKRIYIILPNLKGDICKIQTTHGYILHTLLNLSYQSLPLLPNELNSTQGKVAVSDFWFVPILRERYSNLNDYHEQILSIMYPKDNHSVIEDEIDTINDSAQVPIVNVSLIGSGIQSVNSPLDFPIEDNLFPHLPTEPSIFIDAPIHNVNLPPRETTDIPEIPAVNYNTVPNLSNQRVRRIMRHLSIIVPDNNIQFDVTPQSDPREVINDLIDMHLLSHRSVSTHMYLIDCNNTLYCPQSYVVAGVYNPVTDTVI